MTTDAAARRAAFEQYAKPVREHVESEGGALFDAALVDGRFRGAAALLLLNYLHARSVLIVHDFWPRLDVYMPVLRYYDVVGRTRTVAVLMRKRRLPPGWEGAYIAYANTTV
jgi:hypothetical protein